MKILVTGGAGFIGSHIVDEYIKLGHDVCIIDNMTHGKEENVNKKAKLYKMDIRDKKVEEVFQKEKFDVVSHHAAQISVPNSVENPFEDADININGSLNILECARKHGVKKIIYPASAAIFGEPVYLPVDENHPLNMQCGYGVTKHTIEHYLYVYYKLYGMKYTSFRYSNVYGPRQDSTGEGGVVAIFSEMFLEGKAPCIFGDGKQTRDFVYVKDVAKANAIALNDLDNELFNVATDYEISVNDLFKTFNDLTDNNLTPVYKEERPGDIKYSYMTYDKIKNACGWKPEYSLEKGLKETLDFYKSK
ncbi:NAD-dependent epimerase/dehydratase family protein [Clostridium fallax]|uniref:UDP-glucose 4-epimerase n=1 Tax=Clostridium fallax TaxID=1533 RepID=A0A1M4SX92_9CLOT|nr:NAD-dependent epimerase/dehydratase family protein [Clostridium fallax]SHE36861.1 UDP-glucose 4-epimerase [Clostridium fallax]SQB08016.1 nucleoside-diphosphate-sugar epimerase [Clostridium fallax]